MNSQLQTELAYNETFHCVQCGYCLPSCPTYKSMNKETHSPRGRINLVKMVAEGRLPVEQLNEPIELCLGCRACETVCPTNVPYGSILESAKHVLTQYKKKHGSKSVNWAKELLINKTVPNKKAMNFIGGSIRVYEKTKLKSFLHNSKLINVLPDRLAIFDRVLPPINSLPENNDKQAIYYPQKDTRFRVAFFKGCIMDTVFKKINQLSIKLLAASGCEVTIIDEQTCCGAIHSHSGEIEKAKELAKQNIEAFEKGTYDFIVNSIGGCGAMLVEYDKLLEHEADWKEKAKNFARKNKDISYVLSKCEIPFKKELQKIVTYQPSCHMSNVQKNIDPPLKLLNSIPGITYVIQKNVNSCCGSAGTYSLVHYDESMDILDDKMKNVERTSAQTIVTTNPGCHLQMKVGVERINRSNEIEVVHLVELLTEACDIAID